MSNGKKLGVKSKVSDNYLVTGNDYEKFQEALHDMDNRTVIIPVRNPESMRIHCVIAKSDKEHASPRFVVLDPMEMKDSILLSDESIFSAEKCNIGRYKPTSEVFLSLQNQIKEIEQIGFFLTVHDQKKIIVTPSKKFLTALLLSMLQVQIDYKKIIEAAESRMDTLPETVKEYLKKMFPTGVFGLETIDEVASKVADANRAEKKILVTYTEKSKYEGEIPKDSKEELEKLLSENMQKQAEWKETQKTLQKYQMLIQQREQALKKKESIQHELESLSTVTEIPREVYEQAVSDRQKFLNASRIANQNIATANANIKFQEQILHNINSFEQSNHSCPICPSVHCNADLSAYVRQGQELVQENKNVVKQNKDFLVRCDEQIAKRDQIIEKYQKNQVEITKKQALKKQLEEFVIPQLPEKQTVPNEEELRLLVEQQKLIQQRMRALEEYETTRKYSKLCREQQDKVDMLSLAAKTLDAKVGVKGIILQRILHPFEEACTACMQKLSRNTKIKFIYDGGVELYCEKNGGKMIPMKKVSTGEFVFVAFTLMSLISQITGTRLLVLDNLDSLDNDNLKTFAFLIKLLESIFSAFQKLDF